MTQQLGVAANGTKASWLEIMCHTGKMTVVPVIIKGGVAVTLQPGTALRDYSDPKTHIKTPYTNGDLVVAPTDGVVTAGSLTVLSSATVNFETQGVLPGDTVALSAGAGGGTKTITAVSGGSITMDTAATAATGVTATITRVTSAGVGLQAILLDEVKITTDDAQVTANAVLAGDIRSSKVIDSAGAALEASAKAFLSKGLLLL